MIVSPNGVARNAQRAFGPVFSEVYEADPAAMGFLKGRSVVISAARHGGQNLVRKVDVKDVLASINVARVRGLFLAPPFGMGPAAAAVLAQLCAGRNGLPQGVPTSPVLSDLLAASLDRRLARLARKSRVRQTRYAPGMPPVCRRHHAFREGPGVLRHRLRQEPLAPPTPKGSPARPWPRRSAPAAWK